MKPDLEQLEALLLARFAVAKKLPEASAEATAEESEAEPESGATQLRLRCDFAKVGYDLDVTVAAEQVCEVARLMNEADFAMDMVTAVDWPEEGEFEVLYDYLHYHGPGRVIVRCRIPREDPQIASLSAIYAGANWHERETAEFFGIRFVGHPNPIHLLLPEDFEGYPLRKDFKPATYTP
jgi:NADH-quinone oxidoreductase subunit C